MAHDFDGQQTIGTRAMPGQIVGLSANGQRDTNQNITLDGVAAVDGFKSAMLFVPSLEAIEEFKTLVGLDASARSYAFLGLSYRHLGRFDEARKYFEEGLKNDPRNASCLFNMGFIE